MVEKQIVKTLHRFLITLNSLTKNIKVLKYSNKEFDKKSREMFAMSLFIFCLVWFRYSQILFIYLVHIFAFQNGRAGDDSRNVRPHFRILNWNRSYNFSHVFNFFSWFIIFLSSSFKGMTVSNLIKAGETSRFPPF